MCLGKQTRCTSRGLLGAQLLGELSGEVFVDPDELIEMYQALMALTSGHAVVSRSASAAGGSLPAHVGADDAAFRRAVRILIAGYAERVG